jgi:hypothetical protein
MAKLNVGFYGRLQMSPNPGGWTYLVWPRLVEFFLTHGLLEVRGKIDGHPFRSPFMALGDGRHKLGVKADEHKAIGKRVGQTVKVVLQERIEG